MANVSKGVKEDAPYADFAIRLRKLRKEKNISRAVLAEKCGIVPATLGNYESGDRMPTADIAVKMAETFGITVGEFMGVEKNETAERTENAVNRIRRLYGNTKAKQAEEMLKSAEGLFAGGELSADQQDEYVLEMQRLLIFAIEKAREKYTPKKYRSEEKTAASKERLKETEVIAEEIRSREKRKTGYVNPFIEDSVEA